MGQDSYVQYGAYSSVYMQLLAQSIDCKFVYIMACTNLIRDSVPMPRYCLPRQLLYMNSSNSCYGGNLFFSCFGSLIFDDAVCMCVKVVGGHEVVVTVDITAVIASGCIPNAATFVGVNSGP